MYGLMGLISSVQAWEIDRWLRDDFTVHNFIMRPTQTSPPPPLTPPEPCVAPGGPLGVSPLPGPRDTRLVHLTHTTHARSTGVALLGVVYWAGCLLQFLILLLTLCVSSLSSSCLFLFLAGSFFSCVCLPVSLFMCVYIAIDLCQSAYVTIHISLYLSIFFSDLRLFSSYWCFHCLSPRAFRFAFYCSSISFPYISFLVNVKGMQGYIASPVLSFCFESVIFVSRLIISHLTVSHPFLILSLILISSSHLSFA